jgi:hypothetical protein
MADFLARLAGRTLGSAPTVQPIIAQAFAPKQAWTGENDPGILSEGEVLGDSVQQQSVSPIQEIQPTFYQPVHMPPTLVPQGFAPLARKQNVPSAGAPVMSSRLPFSKMSESRRTPAQHKAPNSLEQSEPEWSPVPGTLTSSDEHRSIDKPPVFAPLARKQEAGTNKGQSYTNPLSLLQRMPARQPSRPSLNASEGVDHAQGMLLPADLDPFSEQARGIEIHPERFQSTPARTRRSMRASHEDGHLDLPNALQTRVSEIQSAMPTRDISPDQRLTQQRGMRPQVQVSANRAYHGGSQHNTSSPGSKHETAETQFIVSPPASPTIQVTIGRIEVRATPPPPSQSQGKRSPSSVMSLDQYLHQRAKGGDR